MHGYETATAPLATSAAVIGDVQVPYAAMSVMHLPNITRAAAVRTRPYPGQVGEGRTYEIRTYGCQMNVHDSERVAGLLETPAT